MQQFEYDYALLVHKILTQGLIRETRNGLTKGLFGETLKVDLSDSDLFPLLQGRKVYPKGVLGEFAALIRKPKSVEDFEKFGCNYWDLWADAAGKLNVDYGNSWFDFNGVDQIAELKDKLRNNPTDRRMVVSGWKPNGMAELSLPCCHLLYQFYVRDGKYLDMYWYQRSVDVMIGLPSDIILAAIWVITLANEFGLKPGCITMGLGDCHVYGEHQAGANEYLQRIESGVVLQAPTYRLNMNPGQAFETFEPKDLVLSLYGSHPRIEFKLKA